MRQARACRYLRPSSPSSDPWLFIVVLISGRSAVIAVSVVDAINTSGVLVSVVIRNHAHIRRRRIGVHVLIGIGFHSGAAGASQSEDCHETYKS
jgi:hypothetical protein